ncbi:MAG: hypothetical protein RLZZ399_358 [Verrucomicrobiota bacterium]|jgi:hypothetical protein
MPFCVFSRLSMEGTFLPDDGGMRLVERRGALFVGTRHEWLDPRKSSRLPSQFLRAAAAVWFRQPMGVWRWITPSRELEQKS